VTLDDLRRLAVARTLFAPTTIGKAIERLGFVQADPIRAPARAQDLTLRHRVTGYSAGDLERRYPALGLEEGVFVNYGFMRRADYLRMHPRRARPGWDAVTRRRARAIVEVVRELGVAHPREIDRRFSHGTTTNYWGGSSNATTHLLGELHYHGLLRVARRDAGVRVYAIADPAVAPDSLAARDARLDALVDIIVRKYAPLPGPSLNALVARLRYATPQWAVRVKQALGRARRRLAHTRVEGVEWYWPAEERGAQRQPPGDTVRLLSPFDPLVWDRRRFELFWGWVYRFEAYTPPAARRFGYYALPLLWRDRIVGWANVRRTGDRLAGTFGFTNGRPRDTAFARELDAEMARFETFLS
jgi:uncharacterized protein YcaQ